MKQTLLMGLVFSLILSLLLTGCGKSAAGAQQEDVVPETEFPLVTIEMDDGAKIYLELYPDIAKNTVNNFIYLVDSGFYDGLTFHRIDPTFMIQGGDPLGTGIGGPGYTIPGEFYLNEYENSLSHTRGVLSMARSQHYDSAGSQFFIVVKDSTFLDTNYAAFGRVIQGMETVDEIANAKRTGETPNSPRVMKTVTVNPNGYEWSEPVKS